MKKGRVLVADDDKIFCMMTAEVLTRSGYSVITASNGKEAVYRYQQDTPDVILMDIDMPVVDGLQAAEMIKSLAGDLFIPILFLTGTDEDRVLARCFAAGGDGFMVKPCSNLALKSKIDQLLREKEYRRSTQSRIDELHSMVNILQIEQEVAERFFQHISNSRKLDMPVNIQHYSSPKGLVSGDIALCSDAPSGKQYVLVGDFTGHGLQAAMGAFFVSELFYSMVEDDVPLKDIVSTINRRLREATPGDFYLAATVLEINHETREIRSWAGACPPALVFSSERGVLAKIESDHMPLGILNDEGFDALTRDQVLPSDASIFLYTDGLVEASNVDGDMFGADRIEAILKDSKNSDELFDNILNQVNYFSGGCMQSDDTTFVEVKFRS
ncbi:MAG: fused response regulator/phosphatase [Gammaproteobacteria bacterium]|nr:fused response regulator/phosphatase [Gammaproteobacteria bacterium]